MSSPKLNVLVTGGSGYVGQFLLQSLSLHHQVHYTFHTRHLPSAPSGVIAHKVDLSTGEGLRDIFDQTPFAAVINCAALSQPGACETAPEVARAVNVPGHLVDCLLRQEANRGLRALLVHFSTDQVYDGSHSYWKEDEACVPVNVYGRTKLEAEQLIASQLPPPHPVAILRCSIIYGPLPPDPIPSTPFLQFAAAALRGDKPTTFFSDEWRNPVYVRDVQRLVDLLIATDLRARSPGRDKDTGGEAGAAGEEEAGAVLRRHRVYNTGGPERLSRVDMAQQIADCLGCGRGLIQSALSSSAPKTVPRPQDISVDMSCLAEDLGFHPTPFRTALSEIFPASQTP